MPTSIYSYTSKGLQNAHSIYPDEGKPSQDTGEPDNAYPREWVLAPDHKQSTYLGYVK